MVEGRKRQGLMELMGGWVMRSSGLGCGLYAKLPVLHKTSTGNYVVLLADRNARINFFLVWYRKS